MHGVFDENACQKPCTCYICIYTTILLKNHIVIFTINSKPEIFTSILDPPAFNLGLPVVKKPATQKAKTRKSIKDFFEILGPSLVTGSSDDDPSGIATYSQAGDQFGFSTLWSAHIMFPLMASIQETCIEAQKFKYKEEVS